MSFRARMAAFFALIVVLPMVVVAVLVLSLTGDSRSGKADSALSTGLRSALALEDQLHSEALPKARAVAGDRRLAAALASGDRRAAERVAKAHTGSGGLEYLRVAGADDKLLASIGREPPVAAARVSIGGPDGSAAGAILGSTISSAAFVQRVQTLTGEDAVLIAPGGPLASTLDQRDFSLPEGGEPQDTRIGDRDVRAASVDLPHSDGLRVTLFSPLESGGLLASSPAVVVGLVAFFLIAFGFALLVVRALQGQVGAMLGAARRIGDGDFSKPLPVVGRDEMAGLASEFNKMSSRLAAQMDELRRQRTEIDRSIRRLGEAFGAGLDREALLTIVAETALGACSATFGRIALTDGLVIQVGGGPDAIMREAIKSAETRAGEGLVEARRETAHALAAPLQRAGSGADPIGVMSIAREQSEFSEEEHDVFRYLIGQASTSVANIAVHEQVSEQAVTDELTGLANKRAFNETIEREAARATRFGHDLSLIILDIDDFKAVNDSRGHLQGDQVLRAIGAILASEPREIDEAARYGGEEFVVALPETSVEGADELAERIRSRIEREPVPPVDGGEAVTITASFGVAVLPANGSGPAELLAAADEALYDSKRSGKNRVSRAGTTAPTTRKAPSEAQS